MFLLGLLRAFSISRISVSSVVFPTSVLLFAIGFLFGFIWGGSFSEVTIKRWKDKVVRISPKKFLALIDSFDGFDVNVTNLKNDVQRAIDTNIIMVGDLENYVNIMENLRLSSLNIKKKRDWENEEETEEKDTENSSERLRIQKRDDML